MWLHMAWYADNLYRHQLLYYYLLRAKHGRYGGAGADCTLGPERIDPKAPETAAPSTSSAADGVSLVCRTRLLGYNTTILV